MKRKISVILCTVITVLSIYLPGSVYAMEITEDTSEIKDSVEVSDVIEENEILEENDFESQMESYVDADSELKSVGGTSFDPICPAVDYPKLYSDSTEYSYQNYTFVVNKDSTTATITGYTGTNDLHIPSQVENYNGAYTVTVIDDRAFWGMNELIGTITIPDTIIQIGSEAFYRCSKLTGDLYIPDNVEKIGRYAFSDCSGLAGELHLPNNDEFMLINPGVFDGCSSLSGVLTIPNSVRSIHRYAFGRCERFSSLVLPSNLYDIGEHAFYYCKGFTGILKLEGKIHNVGDYAFNCCSGFSGIEIDNSLSDGRRRGWRQINIGIYCFGSCHGFSGDLEIPRFVSLGDRAFYYCRGFSNELNIGYTEYMGREVFSGCYGFKKVTNNSSWKIDLKEINPGTWISQDTGQEISELYSGIAILGGYIDEEALLKKYEKVRRGGSFTVGNDKYVIRCNYAVNFDGRKHCATGINDYTNTSEPKVKGNKVYDVFVTVTKNGEIVDPSEYILKTKDNKNASVKISDGKLMTLKAEKHPSYTLQFKNADAELKKEAKYWTFFFDIFPAKLTTDNIKVGNVKRIKNRLVKFGKAEFSPSVNGIKPKKLKYSKKEDKTDYVATLSYEDSNEVTIVGRNNYYGKVELKGITK